MREQFKDRVAEALRAKKMNQAQFAAKIGQSRGNITNWIDGTTNPNKISAEVADKAALELGVSWDYLVKGAVQSIAKARPQIASEYDEIRAPDEIGTDTVEFVRFHPACSVSAGGGFENSEDAAGKVISLSFRSRSLSKRNVRAADAVVINVCGDSMEPTLSDGDQVMYDETRRSIIDGKMYVVRIGGGCFVKRLYTRPNSVLLKSDNPFHEAFEARIDGVEVDLLGQVVWSASWKI